MKIAVLFPGYGSQFVGMGKELYDESRVMQELFEEAAACLPINFVKLCFASSDTDIKKITQAYPALFLVSASIFAILKQEGLVPDVVTGCFGGEYAALYAANAMSFPDALYVLNKFSTLYQDFIQAEQVGAVRITGISARKLTALCQEASDTASRVSLASYDGPQDFLVTGHHAALDRLQELLGDLDVKVKTAAVELGLHSALMEPVAQGLSMYFEKVDFKDAQYPLISCVTGKTLQTADELRKFFLSSITEPVRWDKILNALEPYDVILEVGPASTLSASLREQYPEKNIIMVNKPADVQVVKQLLAPTNVSGEQEHQQAE